MRVVRLGGHTTQEISRGREANGRESGSSGLTQQAAPVEQVASPVIVAPYQMIYEVWIPVFDHRGVEAAWD
jgi:hypothetical protein